MTPSTYFALFLSLYCVYFTDAIELTFELLDKSKDCYYENIEKDTSTTLEYQVVTGGLYDVDVTIKSPTKEILYKQVKSQFDSHTFVAQVTGPYAICFSNEFSTFSHKLVYMYLQVGEENSLPGIGKQVTAMTQMESTLQDIHEYLNNIVDYQTHHRLEEAQNRKQADALNFRVLFFSANGTAFILLIFIGQVFLIRRFFSENTPHNIQIFNVLEL